MAALMRFSNFCIFRPFLKQITKNFCKTGVVNGKIRRESIRYIHRPMRLASLSSVRHEDVEYPAVTPRWPPGFWGQLVEKRAWELYEKAAEIEDTTVLWDKMNKLLEGEHFLYEIKPFVKNSPPHLLPYQQFITKTHLVKNELPEVYNTIEIEEDLQMLQPIIEKNLVIERLRVLSEFEELRANPTLDIADELVDQKLSEKLINCVLRTITDHLSASHEHLFWAQKDVNIAQEAFWAVSGVREECDGLTDDGFMKLQFSHRPALNMRTDLPLPVFTSPYDEICQHPDMVTEWHYTPKVFEISGSEQPAKLGIGFKTKTPFNDPCPAEFGLLSVTCIAALNELRATYCEQEIRDLATGCGLVAAFGSTLTQAHSQGFSWWNDITYPITTQAVVFDGKNISFHAYQLNTLLLWISGEGGVPYNNVCWSMEETPLFGEVTDTSVEDLNLDAVRTLMKFASIRPEGRGVEMRPYLSEHVTDVQAYINTVDEPVIERPHPPRLFAKSKQVKLISPVDETQDRIREMYKRADERWDEKKRRFVQGPRLKKLGIIDRMREEAGS